jgi:hypothetical protein
MFELWAFNKMIARGKHWEDIEDFINELKKLNPNTVDRKNYKIMCNGEVIVDWKRS